MTVLLTRKAVLQGAMEATYGVAAAVGANDGFLVSNPLYTIKPNVMERDFVRNDLSPLQFIIGRKIASMEFSTELRGNGLQNSGLASQAAMITRLFQACGYAMTPNIGPCIKGPYDQGDPPVEVTWAASSQAVAGDVFTATGTLAAGDKFLIDGNTYTLRAAPALVGDVALGAGNPAALQNLAAAVNGATLAGAYFAGTPASTDVAATSGAATLTLAANRYGAWANSIAITYTPQATSEGSWAHATMNGGVDPGTTSDVVAYYMTVVEGGVSGTATVAVTSDTTAEALAAVPITSGSPFTVGTKGLTITPTWTGSLIAGQAWTVWLMPAGLSLDPISDNLQSITLVMHKDGVMHQMPGAYGTFDVTAQSGNYATIKWTFTGNFIEAVDDPNPSPVFERQLPSQVELARLDVGNFPAVVEKFTFNQMNDVQIRADITAADGYIGTRIVSRKPEGGINPEADLVANNDFWGQLAAATGVPFQMRVGHTPGNTVWFLAPNSQYSGLTYADRNGILVYDAGMRFARTYGNDESCFYFC
jgi:hypothetical protein